MQKLRASWSDRTSSLRTLEADITRKNEELASLEHDLDQMETDIQAAGRAIAELQKERERTISDVQRGKEMAAASAEARGVAVDGTAERLSRLREIRVAAQGQQIGARRLMGVDAEREDARLLKAAQDAEFGSEFDSMLFGKQDKEVPASTGAAPKKDAKLPE